MFYVVFDFFFISCSYLAYCTSLPRVRAHNLYCLFPLAIKNSASGIFSCMGGGGGASR